MTAQASPSRPSQARRAGALGMPLLILVLALAGGMAGCSAADPSMTDAPMTTGHPAGAAVPLGDMHMPTADEVAAAWQARPDYVTALPGDWQAAYAYALARPDVLQWLPCHCGCMAIDHRSNLDCFFQRREVSGSYVYEEHASYCDVCVKTANLAQRMLQDGSTMIQVRAAVDTTFGGVGPGTDTPLPPAS